MQNRPLQYGVGDWSSGMIPALGAGGREFDSLITPTFLLRKRESKSERERESRSEGERESRSESGSKSDSESKSDSDSDSDSDSESDSDSDSDSGSERVPGPSR